jgi:carbon starvation protein
MFGIANQMLAVIALAVVSAWLVNEGRARKYLWVTVLPMLFVATTTFTAGAEMLLRNQAAMFNASIQIALILVILSCSAIIVICAARAIWKRLSESPRILIPSLATESL